MDASAVDGEPLGSGPDDLHPPTLEPETPWLITQVSIILMLL